MEGEFYVIWSMRFTEDISTVKEVISRMVAEAESIRLKWRQ
ncbi:MAG: hypothetical protein RR651_06495 [Lysinibacillus sp.]